MVCPAGAVSAAAYLFRTVRRPALRSWCVVESVGFPGPSGSGFAAIDGCRSGEGCQVEVLTGRQAGRSPSLATFTLRCLKGALWLPESDPHDLAAQNETPKLSKRRNAETQKRRNSESRPSLPRSCLLLGCRFCVPECPPGVAEAPRRVGLEHLALDELLAAILGPAQGGRPGLEG
jgi:hypothetical protein